MPPKLVFETSLASDPGTKTVWLFTPTQTAVARATAALVCAALAVYYLHTGRRHADAGRLLWGAVWALAVLGVFLV